MRFQFAVMLVMSASAAAQESVDAVKQAETTGSALFAAMQAKALVAPGDLKNLEALQHAVDGQKCPGVTISWVLLPDRSQPTEIFGISSVPASDQLVVGRHFKATVVQGAVDLSTLAASTKSCLTLKIQPRAVGLFTTEVISATPTEFHVLESKLHGIALYVGAGGHAWVVSDGTIRKLEK